MTARLVFVALLFGCHASPRPPAHDAARASLLATEDRLGKAMATTGEGALAHWFAEDASYLHPGEPIVTGTAPIAQLLARLYPTPAKQTLHRVAGDTSADGQLGYTFGWFERDVRKPDKPACGKYLATWERGRDGWRLAGWVRTAAPKPPSPPPADALILRGAHGTPKAGDPAALRAEAFAADAAFSASSVAEGYTVAFPRAAAPEAAVIGSSDFFWNRAGVAKAWAGWVAGEQLAWAPRLGAAAASGDLAFTIGEATLTTPAATVYSKYLTVWVRQPDGGWQFLLDAGSARPAPR